jgi:Fur family ferric uptake transcriptional regulator
VKPWGDAALAALDRRGHRSGGARRAVVELLDRQSCCLTAQEIHDRLRKGRSPVGLASVYRTLDQLSRDGFVHRIELGDGTTRYEPAHEGADHHHHVVCETCGKVEAFADDELEQALHQVETRTGFAIAGHDVVLRGSCGDCA